MNMHPSWDMMEIDAFGKTKGWCPLCATYHEMLSESGLVYCCHNDINLSGWDTALYDKLSTVPESVDINEYQQVQHRLIKNKLVQTLPLIISRRQDYVRRYKEGQQQQVKVVEKIVQVPVCQPRRISKRDFNVISDYMGLS